MKFKILSTFEEKWVFDLFVLNCFYYNELQIGILILLTLEVKLWENRDTGCMLECGCFYQIAEWVNFSGEIWKVQTCDKH